MKNVTDKLSSRDATCTPAADQRAVAADAAKESGIELKRREGDATTVTGGRGQNRQQLPHTGISPPEDRLNCEGPEDQSEALSTNPLVAVLAPAIIQISNGID